MATADSASPASHGGSDGPGGDRIVTARLVLAPLAVGDAEEMVAVLGDERLHAFTGGRPPTLAELRARYARLVAGRSPDGSEQWRNWIVRLRDGRAVGTVQATITAHVHPGHHASAAVAARAGLAATRELHDGERVWCRQSS